jgi:hypothetical protein
MQKVFHGDQRHVPKNTFENVKDHVDKLGAPYLAVLAGE